MSGPASAVDVLDGVGGVEISVRGVSKMFGAIRALNDVSLEFRAGVTGLLGPNGSGKSTLIKLIAGQLRPDAGTVHVRGAEPFRNSDALRWLGLCPEQDRFYEELGARRFVSALTRLHGYTARAADERAMAALTRVGMDRAAERPLRALSRGMRQRVKIAQAMAHDPPILLLDEPLTGADPLARAELVDIITGLGREGRCVLVSSHVLHEVEAMTHRVAIIRFGRLRAHGDIFRLRRALPDRPYRVEVGVPNARGFAAEALALPFVEAVEILGVERFELTTSDLDATCRALPELAERRGVLIAHLSSPDADLESLYRYLTAEAHDRRPSRQTTSAAGTPEVRR